MNICVSIYRYLAENDVKMIKFLTISSLSARTRKKESFSLTFTSAQHNVSPYCNESENLLHLRSTLSIMDWVNVRTEGKLSGLEIKMNILCLNTFASLEVSRVMLARNVSDVCALCRVRNGELWHVTRLHCGFLNCAIIDRVGRHSF